MSRRSTRKTMFQSAVFRLTVWYVALVMTLSLLFSVTLFAVASNEFGRALGPPRPGEKQLFVTDDNAMINTREQRISESNSRLVVSLVFFNISVLLGGTAISYWLAKRTLEPIEEAHEAQARFASDAAHELRTPLAAMQSEIEVSLRAKKASKEAYRETLESTIEEVGRLRVLTDQLLQLASNQTITKTAFDVEQAVMEAVTRIVSRAQQKDIGVENTVSSALALGSLEHTVEILVILLDNAVKYSPSKTELTVTSMVKDNRVLLSVTDQGQGVAKEEHDKIFERFYRADNSRSKVQVDGYGLGLSLAKRLADEQHGELQVESDGVHGSTFTLSLPVGK